MSYNKTQRDIRIDLIRVVACLSVVLLHVTATFWYSTPIRYWKWGVLVSLYASAPLSRIPDSKADS